MQTAKPSIGFQTLRRIIKALGDYRLRTARKRYGATDGDLARHHNHWLEAVAHYERYLARFPRDIGIRIRLASTWRESGDAEAAIRVLRQAILLRPDKTRLHGFLAEVIDEAGFSDQMADTGLTGAPGWEPYARLQAPPAPSSDRAEPSALSIGSAEVQIIIDAGSASEGQLFETLESLLRSRMGNWRAIVVGTNNAGRDPRIDPRIHLHNDGASASQRAIPSMRLEAGVLLHPHCLGWLLWGLDRGADLIYCDHMVVAGEGRPNSEPVLQAAPQFLDLWINPKPPRIALFRVSDGQSDHSPREAMISAFASRAVMHVPLVLGAAPEVEPVPPRPVPAPSFKVDNQRILIVIPTRNEGAALDVMLRSLIGRAALASRLDVVVVDNGSDEIASVRVLNEWASSGRVHVLRHDEAFNWSRLNNLACEGQDQPLIVFANNDMEMLSDGWDLEVRRLLAMDGVGVVGARLLYPNDRVQHAGIVMGALNCEPLHEGLRVGRDEHGPLDRWVRRRPATAVTGAFMAMRRSVFDQVGGFDAKNFAVSCNDVDFCLRVGAAGWTILYAPELVLRHHESLSRGHSNTEAKQKRVAEEMTRLLARWGDRARFDPTRNPQWEGRGIRLFVRVRSLTAEEVMDWAIKTESRPSSQAGTPTLA